MGYVESLMGKNEKILIIERKHWTTLLMSFLVNLFLVIVILALYFVLGTVNNPSLELLAHSSEHPVIRAAVPSGPLRLGSDPVGGGAIPGDEPSRDADGRYRQ